MASGGVGARGQCAPHPPLGIFSGHADKKTAAPCGAAVLTQSDGANYATVLIFSAASAMRLDSGWNTSPASFIEASVLFELWATSVSKADLA